MSNKPQNYKKELDAILDGLADYVEQAPGDHLLEDAIAAGEDPNQTDKRVKAALLQAITNFEQSKLRAARAAYEKRVASIENRPFRFSDGPLARRQQLCFLLDRNPELGAAFTARHRDFVEMTDDDVESALRDLADLGVLDDMGQEK